MNPGPPLTILQLVPEALPTFRADVAVLFGKYLPRLGVRCDIVGKHGEGEAADAGFASVRRAAGGPRWRRELSYAWLCLRSLLGARRASCDVIQVRDMVSVGVLALLVARAKGIPFVYWMSFLMCEGRIGRSRAEIAAGAGLRSRLVLFKGLLEQRLLHRLILARADHVFVQSEAMLEWLVQLGAPRERLSPVPMGVDTEVLVSRGAARQRPPGWEGVPLVAYLGTLDWLRRLDVVVDALAIVRQRHPQACLLLIGDAPKPADVARLLEHARQAGLGDAVRATGWLASAQARALLAGADVAVSYVPRGSLLDTNSPTKLLEYLALAMPSVGNDNPDQAVVLSGREVGWLTDSNAAALAQGISEVLDAPAAALLRAAAGPAYIDAIRSYRALAAPLAEHYRRLARRAVAPR